MIDNTNGDAFDEDNMPELPKNLGIRMLEIDSYQRIIEGLKGASDGCRHLAQWQNHASWDAFAGMLDKIRSGMVNVAGIGKPSDSDATKPFRGMTTVSRLDAYVRIYDGIHAAAAACRQMASGHRGDLRWSIYAEQLEQLRDSASKMVRAQKSMANVTVATSSMRH